MKKLHCEKVKRATPARGSFNSCNLFDPFNSSLEFKNHQRAKRINRALLKKIALAALAELGIKRWHLTFYLVDAKRMADINSGHMHHEGPTDVITFNYSEHATRNTQHSARTRHPSPTALFGEIFICVDIAVTQAREFRTTWQSEVVRYIVHALLHLCGYDDLKPAARREMKRHENRLVRKLERSITFSKLSSAH